MIFPLSIVSLFGLVCLGLLVSPYPYLAPGAVLGLVAVTVLYRRPAWGLLGIAALVPLEGLFKDNALSGTKLLGASLALILVLQLAVHQIPSGAAAQQCLALSDLVHGAVPAEPVLQR